MDCPDNCPDCYKCLTEYIIYCEKCDPTEFIICDKCFKSVKKHKYKYHRPKCGKPKKPIKLI
jgi:hypothetical protein